MAENSKLRVLPSVDQAADVVKAIEDMLVMAKRGEISSVAIAAVTREGDTITGWSKLPSFSAQIGAVARLQYRLLEASDS